MASSAFSFHCMICFEEFDPVTNYPVVLPCGHTYVCIECANRLDKCMECRTPLTMKVEQAPPPPPTPSTPGPNVAAGGASPGLGSPDVQQKENHQNRAAGGGGYADRVRNSPGFRRRYGQRDEYRTPYSTQAKPAPTPPQPAIKQRLPLPKNAVLLSLIQASEPARRRAEVDAPPTPQKPEAKELGGLPPIGSETPSPGNRAGGGGSGLPKYSRPSPLFLDGSSSTEGDGTSHHHNLVVGCSSVDDEEHKIRVGTYLEGGPCGTYAVAVKEGLLVYPTLFEHTLPSALNGLKGRDDDDDDIVKRDVEELVKKHRASKISEGKDSPEIRARRKGVSTSSDVGVSFEDTKKVASSAASDVGQSSSLFQNELGGVSVECHGEGDFETSCSLELKSSLDGEEILPLKQDEGKGAVNGEASSDPGVPPAYEENDVGLSVSLTISEDEEGDAIGASVRTLPARRSQSIMETSSSKAAPVSPLHAKDDAEPITKTYSRHLSHGSAYHVSSKNKNKAKNKKKEDEMDEFDRPLIRLKYGDRVQVVSMDSRGWVKLARGYGYIRLENDKQLVKVGGTSDKACQIEAMLHELSLERNNLKNEQMKLERLSAGLMIDLQSTLLTSDDLVVVPAPEGSLLRSESELSLAMRRSERANSNVSVDDIDVSVRSRKALTPPRGSQSDQDTHRQIRSAKSHSPGRSQAVSPTNVGATRRPKAPPSPPYGQITSSSPQTVNTPTRVNFRTGMSGHRALTSSHSHPHDFIDRGYGVMRSMSNHAGISSKKPSSRGRSIY